MTTPTADLARRRKENRRQNEGGVRSERDPRRIQAVKHRTFRPVHLSDATPGADRRWVSLAGSHAATRTVEDTYTFSVEVCVRALPQAF